MSDAQVEGVVLVIGGSGYLGLHLLQYFATSTRFLLAFTYSKSDSPPPAPFLQKVPSFRVDLRTGAGLNDISDALGPPSIVVNCAAIATPRECEENPELADGVNVPRSIVHWLKSFAHNKPLLIHLSTDQVYAGTKLFYKEEDETKPVNVYGKTKVDAEKLIRANWPNYAILRSSIIYGPQPAFPVPKTLPIQWIDSTLVSGTKTDFFSDEFRCPVYVKDVVKVVVLIMINSMAEGGFAQLLLNVGGPDRLSRAGMAEVVAQVRGHDLTHINHVSASTVNRGVKSPLDISMNISKVKALLGINMTSFSNGVKETFEYNAPVTKENSDDIAKEETAVTKENKAIAGEETKENSEAIAGKERAVAKENSEAIAGEETAVTKENSEAIAGEETAVAKENSEAIAGEETAVTKANSEAIAGEETAVTKENSEAIAGEETAVTKGNSEAIAGEETAVTKENSEAIAGEELKDGVKEPAEVSRPEEQ